MIHWKNKRLDKLSNTELQQALTESISTQFNSDSFAKHNDITSTFVIGILVGATIATLAIYASIL